MTLPKQYVGSRVTFKELFIKHPRVEIPIIQRDYAQGREAAQEVRTLFLDAMYAALSKNSGDPTLPLDLDFVYGSIEGIEQPAFCPLDGQQRLTTLLLLCWYLAWVDGKSEEFASFAAHNNRSRFAYSVRASSGEFFDVLIGWFPAARPKDVMSLRSLVEDQSWFFQWWKRDSTIQSALTMLDAIHDRFHGTTGFYDRIARTDSPYITFQLLDLDNFGLSDDLYIKMNARGKPLTEFETFKALIEKHIGLVLPEPDARTLHGRPSTLKNYFSHQIDTTWAELFWGYRDKTTNLFDARMMNLMRVVGIITRNPDEEGIEKVFEILRSPDVKLSFQKYIDIRCLDRAHIELFIMLLDAFSGTTSGAIRSYLPDKRYFDEESTFNRIVEEGGRATYAELIQFSAYAHFLRIHGVGADSVRFGEWMRVIRNLTINSIIERPAQFKSALRSVNDLLDHSYDMLDFLIKNECQPEVFSDQQIREERIKASLIRKSTRWKDAVVKAEQHGYFRGQIEFLLDFSGIIDAWKPTPLSDWSESEDDQYFAKFSAYLEKICLLFNSTGLITLGEFRTERALLSIGNYLFDHRQNRSFLENVSYPLSWKRLLRGEQIQKAGERRGFLKELLDKIDVKVGAAKSLDSIIASATIPDKWRSLIVKNSKFIEYCGKRQIRFCSGTKVYLLRGERRSGEHAELFSYQAYWELVERSSSGDLEPFRTPNYKFVRTDTDEPSIVFTYLAGKVKLQMDIWNVGSKFKLRVHATPDSIPECLRRDFREQPDFGFDENGDLSVNVEMDKLNETIDRVVEIVRKNVVS